MSIFCEGRSFANAKVSDLRRITVTFHDGTSRAYVMHVDDVEKFKIATLRLHHDPGVNPVNGSKTARLLSIKSQPLDIGHSFWWSTPDLQSNDDPRGAYLLGELTPTTTLWVTDEIAALT